MIRVVPAVLALLVLGAHFLRQGGVAAFLVCLLLPAVALLYRRRWVLRVWQFLLAFGAFVWASTAVELTQERIAEGRAFLRMAAILTALSAFTAAAAWLAGRPAVAASYE